MSLADDLPPNQVMDGKMVEFREGEKTMIEKQRAETWQKRGIVRIEQQQQRQGAQ